jgi:pimeloyl-ACP methyl ester carboxylesterase
MISTEQCLPVTQLWQWHGLSIRYQSAGTKDAPVLLIHGFGASSDHWHKNISALAGNHRVYAIDLVGFGQSAKPKPTKNASEIGLDGVEYSFETWATQILDFCQHVIGEPTILVGNSIGCIVALQAAVIQPDWIQGVAMLNCSLRLLHDRKRVDLPWYRNFGSSVLQKILAQRPIGHFFFSQLAKPRTVRKILLQAYGCKTAVTDELVELLLAPARDLGAADVFLAFISYSQGPLAEELLPQLTCPVLILWGADDPWEAIALGREFANYPAVEDFIPLEGVGHCPQDEAPEQVNPLLQGWIDKIYLRAGTSGD